MASASGDGSPKIPMQTTAAGDSHLVDGALDLASCKFFSAAAYITSRHDPHADLRVIIIGPSDAACYSWFHVRVPALRDALSSYIGVAGVTAIDLACALPISLWCHFAAKSLTQLPMLMLHS